MTQPHGLDHFVLRFGQHHRGRTGAKRGQRVRFVGRRLRRTLEQAIGGKTTFKFADQATVSISTPDIGNVCIVADPMQRINQQSRMV